MESLRLYLISFDLCTLCLGQQTVNYKSAPCTEMVNKHIRHSLIKVVIGLNDF